MESYTIPEWNKLCVCVCVVFVVNAAYILFYFINIDQSTVSRV